MYLILLSVDDGPWPKLFYSGYIFNFNYFAIVTEFVKGRCPKRADKRDFEICLEALKKLHELDIIHGDARPPNFLISTQKAYILDFGFSFKVDEIEEKEEGIKRDYRKMKSGVGFNINIYEN